MDEDGFQQVKNRKNTKRNIFNIVNDEMKSNAFALAEETRAARNRSKHHDGEASRLRQGQNITEISAARHREALERNKNQANVSGGGIKGTAWRMQRSETKTKPTRAGTGMKDTIWITPRQQTSLQRQPML